jgi:hypothetical protein
MRLPMSVERARVAVAEPARIFMEDYEDASI